MSVIADLLLFGLMHYTPPTASARIRVRFCRDAWVRASEVSL
jgi:hypothetical protein